MNKSYTLDYTSVNRAFTKQALHYDEDDLVNPVLLQWRKQVYKHVDAFLKPNSFILELNAGTGIDAVRFVSRGHRVLATDLSDGMIEIVRKKIKDQSLLGKLSCEQCSFENLDQIQENNFDFIFSNFGGLNCTDDLTRATKNFNALLKPNGVVTLVIMPPLCPWEWTWLFTGHRKNAFRRFSKNGSVAHLEGEFFPTYYYSLQDIKKAMGNRFETKRIESLGLLSPPPSKGSLANKFPVAYKLLLKLDNLIGAHYPFNRMGDHLIVTFQKIQ